MALTISTDLVALNDADAIGSVWLGIGSGTAAAGESDFWVQRTGGSGDGSVSRAVSGTGVTKGMWYNYGSGLDFSSLGAHYKKLIYMWIRCNTPKLINPIATGGVSIRLGTTTTDYNEYYVGGSDYGISDSDGWVMYVVDPSQTRSNFGGGGLTLSSIQYFGATITTSGTAKGQNIGIDQISYGRGIIRVSGTNTTAGEGFKEIATWDWGTKSRRYGMIVEKGGVYYCKCKFIIGDAVGSAGTTFSSYGETLVWETPMYYNATARVKAVPDVDVAGLNYWGIDVVGNATTPSGDTACTFGVLVGTDSGRSGSNFSVASNPEISSGSNRQAWYFTRSAAVEDLDMYATTFKNCERADEANAIDFTTADANDKVYACTFNSCGRIYFAAAEVRNSFVLNSIVGTNDGSVKWDNSSNIQKTSFINPAFHSVVVEAAPSPALTFTNIIFSPATLAVRYEGATDTVVAVAGGTTGLTAENAGAGTMTFSESVPISVTVVDSLDQPIVTARVGIFTPGGTEILNDTTNGSGVVTGSYSGGTPQAVSVRVRKNSSTDNPRYIPVRVPQSITGSGLSIKLSMTEDTIVV